VLKVISFLLVERVQERNEALFMSVSYGEEPDTKQSSRIFSCTLGGSQLERAPLIF
jgi:hypothetical protein